jgi:hypothetical protein
LESIPAEPDQGQEALLDAINDLRCAKGHLTHLKGDPAYDRIAGPIGNVIGILRALTNTGGPIRDKTPLASHDERKRR